ncbi:MAG: hypothetical protein ACETWE_07095 [Candidatus Bathyarchaeia archaeon]
MSVDGENHFLSSILGEIERHEDIYKFVELKSVIARREEIASTEGKWYSWVTLIKPLYSGSLKPWEKPINRNNFAILSTVITIDVFQEILERLAKDHVLEIDGYEAYGPFNFHQRAFIDSEQSKRLFDIDWAVNHWLATGKQNPGLPPTLELESEDVPFENPNDAIRYYTGISVRSDSRLQNAVSIVAPLYYARIKKVDFSGKELFVETDFNLVDAQDVKIRYNTAGPDERSRYYKTVEARTVQPDDRTIAIQLQEEAENATVWLYHAAGHKIDSRRVTRTPSIEKLDLSLTPRASDSVGFPHLWDDQVRVMTDAIVSRSKTMMPDLVTTELGVDSIDVDILGAIKTVGGDYALFIPEILKYLSLDTLLSRLARLSTLGLMTLQPPRKIVLTPLGVDALNLPPSVLPARVPSEFGRRIAEIQSAFRQENYDEVTNKSTKLLEACLRERLETEYENTLEDVWSELKLEPYSRASLGTLKEACIRLNIFARDSIPDHLISTVLKLRVPMSHEKRFSPESSPHIALLTLRQVEGFFRDWYYLEGFS